MVLKANGGRLRVGAGMAFLFATTALLPASPAVAAGSAPAVPPASAGPGAAAGGAASQVPGLPTVGPDITDGVPAQTLYDMAIALSQSNGLTTRLQAQISSSQKDLDAATVKAREASQAEVAANQRESGAEAQAKAAGKAYANLKGALKQAVVFMYTAGPAYVRINPAAGRALAYAGDYADTALTPNGLLSTRRYDASVRSAALAAASADQQQAVHEAQAASQALTAETNAETLLESQLSVLKSGSGPQLLAEHTSLASQAGQELVSATSLEFTPLTPVPAPLSTNAVAIGWVFSELGKNYLWGGTGPDQFDCSGLMQYAWRQAGVDIPRVAADQDTWTVPVPLSQLLPGDLVFFGQSDIHHVGMYIGDGLMINAPHTGDVVRVSSIWWSDLAGFGRVHDPNTPVPARLPPSAVQPVPPVVVPTAGAVPSQTAPPPGWQPTPGSTTPIAVDTTPAPGDGTTTTTTPSDTTSTSLPDPTTTVATTSTTAPPVTSPGSSQTTVVAASG